MTIEHDLFVEKYRPTSLDDLVVTDDVRNKLDQWLEEKDIPHLLLAGEPGCGKSTLAMILRDGIAGTDNSLTINASHENGVDSIRTKVTNFARCQSFGSLKVCVFEEADQITFSAQKCLLKILEDYSKHTRFIFTCNYPDRIDPALKSRCQSLSFQPFTKKQMLTRLAEIMVAEKIKGDVDQLGLIVDSVGSDMRAAINKLQYASVDGKLHISKEMLMNSDIKFQIVKLLNDKNLTAIRQLVIDEMVKDFNPIYRFLFDKADDITLVQDKSKLMMTIAEHMYRDSSGCDKEINFANMCLHIMTGVK